MDRDRWWLAEFGDKLSWSRKLPIPVTDVYPAIEDIAPIPILQADPFILPTEDAPSEPYPIDGPTVMQLPAIAFIPDELILPSPIVLVADDDCTDPPYPETPQVTDCGDTEVIPATTIPMAFMA